MSFLVDMSVFIFASYLDPWESEKTGDLYCKNDLCVTYDWKAETSYTFRWQSTVQALLKNSLCSFQFQAPLLSQLNTPPGCVCERDFLCSWWKLIADIHQLILDPRIEYNDILVIYTSFTKYLIRHGYFWMTVNEQMCFLAVYHLQKLNQTPVSIYESPHLNNCRVK